MNILVTGGAGYIGSVLISLLLRSGYEIKCLDRFFFGKQTLDAHKGDPNLMLISDDVRWFDPEILTNMDAVIDLAALSNDPAGKLDPKKTYEINFKGRARVAELAKKYEVERYILASSCSIYGFQDGIVNENSPTNPLSAYAEANLRAENYVLPLSDNKFCVTVLRQVLESPSDDVNGEIFNVGSNDQNFQIMPLVRLIAESIGIPFNFEWYDSLDKRSYRVDFTKIRDSIGFRSSFTPRDGAREVYAGLREGKITDNIRTRTIDWLKHLSEMQKCLEK
jgi:nucleoside-diphosphate-sugar epimerase